MRYCAVFADGLILGVLCGFGMGVRQRGRCPSRFYGATELQNLFLHCEPRYAIMHSDVAFKAGSS